ncbi:hypothetical protein XENTR_v10018479 [Xenopus tropicalis]|uniref:Uncharacterized protein LOC100488382 n=1 Tax=Xenopus tropicalis TaxID=8364 RepID=A0A8J0QZB2_XENTR|nr:uncharacterized protein LOC100488382 [Xenopus tropicalis]KAE8591519.1 hypothetical protein XENTR_v10018479 [Xenopus tropicalis]KAE8591520.1 hypothetical protein XENTR_v10018479 [Xenopus tropicalis]|eukprot:XP_002943169.1 PREDICTED: uncharacterized protein LOC100488382 [Xenopus tropicalis]
MASVPSSLGLLSGYISSGSDDEEETVQKAICTPTSSVNCFKNPHSRSEEGPFAKKGETEKECMHVNISDSSVRLPAPVLGSQNTSGFGGVFSNPFHEEEQAQMSILERHVKLSDNNWALGRGACLSYQKDGRCRYGTRCKYSHGSDLPQGNARAVVQELGTNYLLNETSGAILMEGNKRKKDEHDVDETRQCKEKKKKVGLTNSLIPPKKYLKDYKTHVANERPWAL